MGKTQTEKQSPPTSETPSHSNQKQKPWLISGLIFLLALSLGASGYLAYQNSQLQEKLVNRDQVTPTPDPNVLIPPTDPTAGWEIYLGDGYSFKYPKGLKSDTGAAGQGIESISVQFVGPKQGRKEGSLLDGYTFVVTKLKPDISKTAQQQAQEERANSEKNCNFDQSTISSVIQTQIAGTNAWQFSITECLGDSTHSFLTNGENLYRISQLYTGEEAEVQKYKTITDQILSTFKFTTIQTKSSTHYYLEMELKSPDQVPETYYLGEYLQNLLNLSKEKKFNEVISKIVYDTREEKPRTPDHSEKYNSNYYIALKEGEIIAGKYEDEYTTVNVSQVRTDLEPYIDNPDYCVTDSDCTIRMNFCTYGSFNYYHPFAEVWGCGPPSDETGYTFLIYDEKMDCETNVTFDGSKCLQNQCVGQKRQISCK